MSAGKGDRPRPVNYRKYCENYDLIDQLYKQLNDAYREIKRLSNENLSLKMEIEKAEKTSWELATKLYKAENDTAPPAARNTTPSA